MTSHDKGDAKRVACTNPGCQNAAFVDQTIPLPDDRPGARRGATMLVSYLWTLTGLAGDAAVGAARCFVHKEDGYVPFPVPVAASQQGFRPSTDPRFRATPPSRPRSAPPSAPPATRPAAPPRSNAGSGGRPQNAPRAEPVVERPQARSVEATRAQRPVAPAARTQQQAIRPAAPHVEVLVARPAARPAAPAARPVASPRPSPRSDRSRTTFGDLGFNPDVFAEAWKAHKAKKAAERGEEFVPEAPTIVEIAVAPEPVVAEVAPALDAAPAEASELIVQDGPIIVYRSRKAGVVVEPENFFGEVESVHFFRRNKPVEHVLECGLEVAVGEMPGPPIVRKIEETERGSRITLIRGSDTWTFDMFHAFDPKLRAHVWAYRESEDGCVFTRTEDGLYEERELIIEADAFVLGPRLVWSLESDELQVEDAETPNVAPPVAAERLSA